MNKADSVSFMLISHAGYETICHIIVKYTRQLSVCLCLCIWTYRTVFMAGFKCMEALGRIIISGPYPPSNAVIYMHLQ